MNADSIPVIFTSWIVGIELDTTIILGNSIKITPISEMPESVEKYDYTNFLNPMLNIRYPRPKAALTYEGKVKKATDFQPGVFIDSDSDIFTKSSLLLHQTSLLLNIFDGVSCATYWSTSYAIDNMSLEVLHHARSGGFPQQDVGLAQRSV